MRRYFALAALVSLVAVLVIGCTGGPGTVYGGGELTITVNDTDDGTELLSVTVPGVDADALPDNHDTDRCPEIGEASYLVARDGPAQDDVSLEACVAADSGPVADSEACGLGFPFLRLDIRMESGKVFGGGAIPMTDGSKRGLYLGFDADAGAFGDGAAVEVADPYDVATLAVEDTVTGELSMNGAIWRCTEGDIELATTDVMVEWAFDEDVNREAVVYTDEP